MEAQEITYYVKLVAKSSDPCGYVNYVFENLEYDNIDNHYVMCVQFPNWDQSQINIDDVGYAKIKYVEAGVDKWYDGNDFVAYKYPNIVFLKFIRKYNVTRSDNIVLD